MFWSIDSYYPLNIIFATNHNFEYLLNVIFYYFYNCQIQLMRSQIGRHVCYSNQSQARLDGRNWGLAKTRHCFFGISNICSDRIWGHQASSLSWSVQEATLFAKTEALPHLAGIGLQKLLSPLVNSVKWTENRAWGLNELVRLYAFRANAVWHKLP